MDRIKFDEERGSVVEWALVSVFGTIPTEKQGEVLDATKDGAYEMVLTINGVEVSFKTLVTRWEKALDDEIARVAEEKIKDKLRDLDDLTDEIDYARKHFVQVAVGRIRDKAAPDEVLIGMTFSDGKFEHPHAYASVPAATEFFAARHKVPLEEVEVKERAAFDNIEDPTGAEDYFFAYLVSHPGVPDKMYLSESYVGKTEAERKQYPRDEDDY